MPNFAETLARAFQTARANLDFPVYPTRPAYVGPVRVKEEDIAIELPRVNIQMDLGRRRLEDWGLVTATHLLLNKLDDETRRRIEQSPHFQRLMNKAVSLGYPLEPVLDPQTSEVKGYTFPKLPPELEEMKIRELQQMEEEMRRRVLFPQYPAAHERALERRLAETVPKLTEEELKRMMVRAPAETELLTAPEERARTYIQRRREIGAPYPEEVEAARKKQELEERRLRLEEQLAPLEAAQAAVRTELLKAQAEYYRNVKSMLEPMQILEYTRETLDRIYNTYNELEREAQKTFDDLSQTFEKDPVARARYFLRGVETRVFPTLQAALPIDPTDPRHVQTARRAFNQLYMEFKNEDTPPEYKAQYFDAMARLQQLLELYGIVDHEMKALLEQAAPEYLDLVERLERQKEGGWWPPWPFRR